MKTLISSTLSLGVLFTLSLVTNALLLRFLGIASYPASSSLALRALGCLVIALFYSMYKGDSLVPKKPKFQFVRAVLAAFSLLAVISSYHYIHASTVTLLQRLDLLILCLLGFHASTVKNSNKYHVWAIMAAFALVTYLLKDPSEQLPGYILASLGAVGIAVGYMFMKKSQASENFSITILVPSVSCIILGVILGLVANPTIFLQSLRSPLALYALVSGACMFASYYLTLKLYQRMNIATAEFPTLLATTIVMPLESYIFGRELHASVFLFDTIIVLWLSWLLGVPQHFASGFILKNKLKELVQ